jgi:hypothetical protein
LRHDAEHLSRAQLHALQMLFVLRNVPWLLRLVVPMTSDLSNDISKYREACEQLRKIAIAPEEDAHSLFKAEEQVELLEAKILTEIPTTRADLFVKMAFVSELIQLYSDAEPSIVGFLKLLQSDVSSYLDRNQ